jgi:hypothetical protein
MLLTVFFHVKYDQQGQFIIGDKFQQLRQYIAYMIVNSNASLQLRFQGNYFGKDIIRLTVSLYNALAAWPVAIQV